MQLTEAQQVLEDLDGPARRDARLAQGKTQMQVAIECGTQIITIRSWERGVMPRHDFAAQYVQALGLAVDAT